eukprot:GEMP01036963.1.p1 GENE.GEMP01036963.1~~GEMP01036963.1.p1  ORF type:complete len:186 (-),score=33.18 GEMP01036963.1:1394-1951(-)
MGLFTGDDSSKASSFTPPPSAEVSPILKTPTVKTTTSYDDQDFTKFTSRVKDSDGLHDDVSQINTTGRGYDWTMSLHPRVRHCLATMKAGFKMGAAIGGCFGLLTGGYTAVAQRQILMLPVCAIGGAFSFGFFVSCGMIIRCEETSEKQVFYHPMPLRLGAPQRLDFQVCDARHSGLLRRYIPAV